MYYNARYYDPAIGQFISPDTIVPDPKSLLDWNRYLYVAGNPLNYIDPDGHQKCRSNAGICTKPGAEEVHILNAAGVTSNEPELAADAVHDLAEKIGSYQQLKELLKTDAKTPLPIEYEAGRPCVGRCDAIEQEEGTGCALQGCQIKEYNAGVRVYTRPNDHQGTLSITVHELGHVMDFRSGRAGLLGQGYKLSWNFPQLPRIAGRDWVERFARGVATWIYGEDAAAGQRDPLTKEQEEYLEEHLGGE